MHVIKENRCDLTDEEICNQCGESVETLEEFNNEYWCEDCLLEFEGSY